jgi:hypothetical protein
MKRLIGFAGRKRAGKTALSHHLKEKYGCEIITIAQALKELGCKLVNVESIDKLNELKDNDMQISFDNCDEMIENWVNILSQEIGIDNNNYFYAILENKVKQFLSQNSFTVRDMLQYIGSEIIRQYNENWHLDKLEYNIKNSTADIIVVDDVRYPNERNLIAKMGGDIFFVLRPDLSIDISNHSSEVSLNWVDFNENRIIINYLPLEMLFKEFDAYFETGFTIGSISPIFKHGANQFNEVNTWFGCQRFPMDKEEKEIIINQIIPYIKQNNGCIVLHALNKKQINLYNEYFYNLHKKISNTTQVFTFMIWNPFIIENLKAWLN